MFRSNRPSSGYFIVYNFIRKNILEWKMKMINEKKYHYAVERYRISFCSLLTLQFMYENLKNNLFRHRLFYKCIKHQKRNVLSFLCFFFSLFFISVHNLPIFLFALIHFLSFFLSFFFAYFLLSM